MARGRVIPLAIMALGVLATEQVERTLIPLLAWLAVLIAFLAAYCLWPGILGDE